MESGGPAVQPEVKTREGEHWKARPFARTFDLLASEYGWSDDQILDLTLGRMRQVREVIWERLAEDRRRALKDKEAEVKTLASFMAQSREALAAAKAIRMVEDDEDETPQIRPIPYDQARRMFGG